MKQNYNIVKQMKKQRNGFTLVELVIVIVIVGILTIVAVPVYQYYVERARFTEAFAMLRAIADANTHHYLEKGSWCDNINDLDIQIDGPLVQKDNNLMRFETKHFIYASCGDNTTSQTIATANRKPYKERYWISFAAVPNKAQPTLGKYKVTGDATYNKSTTFDKVLVKSYLDKYSN